MFVPKLTGMSMKKIFAWSKRHAFLVFFVVAVLSVLSLLRLPYLQIDPTLDRLLVQSDPAKLFYNKIVDVFGSDELTTIYIQDDSLFSSDKLHKIKDAIEKIKQVSGVVKIDSLFNSPHFSSVDGMLESDPVFLNIPRSSSEILKKLEAAQSNPFFKGQLVSDDGKAMVIAVKTLLNNKDRFIKEKFKEDIDDILLSLKDSFKDVFQIGDIYIQSELFKIMKFDQKVMIPVGILLIAIVLWVMIGRIHAAILPLIVGTVSVLITMAVMTFLNIPVQILIITVPTLLIVIGSAEITHMISEYLHGLEHHKNSKRLANKYLAEKIGLAVVLAAGTTIVGFLSNAGGGNIMMLMEFGKVAGLGLFISFCVTVLFVPAYLDRFVFLKQDSAKNRAQIFVDNLFLWITKKTFSAVKDYRPVIFLAFIAVSAVSLFYAPRVVVDNDSIRTVKESSDIRQRLNILKESFAGISTLYLTLTSENEDAFKKNDLLKKLFILTNYIGNETGFDAAQSFASYVALINQGMHENDRNKYDIPESDNLIEQYMLFLTRDDISSFLSADGKVANIVIRHHLSSSHAAQKELDLLMSYAQKLFKGNNIDIQFTGRNYLNVKAAATISESQMRSVFTSAGCIFLVMSILFMSFKAGVISLIPNLTPVLWLMGVMGVLNVPLDVGTCLIGSIAIGLAIDDTIHFFVRYKEAIKNSYDRLEAIKETMYAEHRAIITTSVSLSFGLSVLAFSNFVPIIEFGVLTAFVLLSALPGDLFITPSLLVSTKMKQFVTLIEILQFKLSDDVFYKSGLFVGMSKNEAKRILLMGTIKKFDIGEEIAFGKNCETLFLIVSGNVLVKKRDLRGDNNNFFDHQVMTPGSISKYDVDSLWVSKERVSVLIMNKGFVEEIKSTNKNFKINIETILQKISMA